MITSKQETKKQRRLVYESRRAPKEEAMPKKKQETNQLPF